MHVLGIRCKASCVYSMQWCMSGRLLHCADAALHETSTFQKRLACMHLCIASIKIAKGGNMRFLLIQLLLQDTRGSSGRHTEHAKPLLDCCVGKHADAVRKS